MVVQRVALKNDLEYEVNFLDRVIRYVSPEAAFNREHARLRLIMMRNTVRSYSGAAYGPLTEDWRTTSSSAKAEISKDIVTLRNRMRELVRNDGYAYNAIQKIANNTIGKGIRPSFVSSSDSIRKKVEKFNDWCDSTDCDFVGDTNFYGLESLSVKGMAESGDCIIIRRYIGKGKDTRLALQLLENDYLVTWYNSVEPSGQPKGARVLNGVYYDKGDRVLGYEIFSEHPGDSLSINNFEHTFVSADDCILLYRADRPNQSRGVPHGSSVMLEHKMLSQYSIATAHKQNIAALFTAFITTTATSNFGASSGAAKHAGIPEGDRLVPGTIQHLIPGESVEFAEPPSNTDFDPYTRACLRKMANGWGLSYEVFSGDYGNVNFSSGRMGWIEMHRNIESLQWNIIIPKLCNTVFKWWLELEQLKGNVPLNVGNLSVSWTPPRREMIDPVKEVKALIEMVQAGFKSFSEAVRELGCDPEALMNMIAQDNAGFDSRSLVLLSDYRNIQKQKTESAIAKDKVTA